MKINALITLFATLVLLVNAQDSKKRKPTGEAFQPLEVMFYNVENLFDTKDDPINDDKEFLPTGEYKWDDEKLDKKLQNIHQVVLSLGYPEIIGVCEIENREVLEMLITKTALKEKGYNIVHFDSPDQRGIDVGLLFNPKRIKLLSSKKVNVKLDGTGKDDRPTRDILYAKLQLITRDTLHVFVNHWPSRSGGEKETEPKRAAAAKALKATTDSILKVSPNSKIIAMGDFNDYPNNSSLKDILSAELDTTKGDKTLYNLMGWQMGPDKGSQKYRENWGFLDQFVVSNSLIFNTNGTYTKFNQAKVNRLGFLLEKDARNGGDMPLRTYGEKKKYIAGYSDHLPVTLTLHIAVPKSPKKKK